MSKESTRDSRKKSSNNKSSYLRAGGIDSHCFGCDFILADREKSPPVRRLHEASPERIRSFYDALRSLIRGEVTLKNGAPVETFYIIYVLLERTRSRWAKGK